MDKRDLVRDVLAVILIALVVFLLVIAMINLRPVDTPEPAPETDAQEMYETIHARIDAELAMIAQAFRDAGIETYDLILARRLRAGVE